MGLFDFIKKAGRSLFRAVKKPVSSIFRNVKDSVRKAVRTIASPMDLVNEGIKKLVSSLKSDPQLGPIARQGIEIARSDPNMSKILNTLESTSAGVDALESFGRGDNTQAKNKLRSLGNSLKGVVGSDILRIANKI